MYPNLYKGLNLKPEDLEMYDSPLMGFDGRMVIPRGMIRLPVQARGEEVQSTLSLQKPTPFTQLSWLDPSFML